MSNSKVNVAIITSIKDRSNGMPSYKVQTISMIPYEESIHVHWSANKVEATVV